MHIDRILANSEIRNELRERLASEEGSQRVHPRAFDREALGSSLENMAEGARGATKELEAIVRRFGRPVLLIRQNAIEEPESELWQSRLQEARVHLEAVIPAIGRIEVRNHPSQAWLGTGWLVAPEVVVTNRHVAVEFGRKSLDSFQFKRNPLGKKMRPRIDFREEFEEPDEDEFRLREILHIEPDEDGAPDIAFLRIARLGEDDQDLPMPVPLAAEDPAPDQVVGAIGYAAWDGRRNDEGVMDRIFESIYNVKRLHPGEVISVREHLFTHDCSTLGGNSGSPVIDLATGEAVGLHFAGSFEVENFAVKASTVRQRLADLGIA